MKYLSIFNISEGTSINNSKNHMPEIKLSNSPASVSAKKKCSIEWSSQEPEKSYDIHQLGNL